MRSLIKCSMLLSWVFFLSACGGSFPKPDDALQDPQDLIKQVALRGNGITDLRIQAKADYWDEGTGERVMGNDVSIVAKSPAMLRVTLTHFDKAIASLASDGVQFQMLDLHNQRFYQGQATVENISRLLPIHLSSGDFFQLLCGAFPTDGLAPGWEAEAKLGWDEDTGHYVMEIPRQGDEALLVKLTYPDLNISELQIRDSEGLRYLYRAKEFAKHDGLIFPEKARFEVVRDEVDLTLRVKVVESNVGLPDQIFSLRQPKGTELIEVGVY